MAFHSINLKGRTLDKDLAKYLPETQLKFLDDYTEKLAGVLISQNEILTTINNAAESIAEDYLSRGIDTIVGVYVLDGARKTFGHLQTALFNNGIRMIEDNIQASRYGSGIQGESIRYNLDVSHVFPNDHVLLIEDIFDEGITMESIAQHLETNSKPANVKLFSLLFKPGKYEGKRRVDYPIFKIDNHWIAGFGMDLSSRLEPGAEEGMLRAMHRDLPFIAATNPDYLLKTGILNRENDYVFIEKLRSIIRYKETAS